MSAGDLQAALQRGRRLLRADFLAAWHPGTGGTARLVDASPPLPGLAGCEWPLAPAMRWEAQRLETGPAALGALLPASALIGIGTRLLAVLTTNFANGGGLIAGWTGSVPDADEVFRCGEFLMAEFGARVDAHMRAVATAEAAARLDAVSAALPQAVVFVDSDGRPGRVNASAAALLELAEGDVTAEALAKAMAALQARALNASSLAAAAPRYLAGEDARIKGWVWLFPSSPTALRVSSTPVRGQDVRGRVWVFDDISVERKSIEEVQAARHAADAANAAKSAFLANISHELRSPLTAVMGFAEVMKLGLFGPLPERYQAYAGNIHDSAAHLLALINDLLDLAKLEAGRMDLRLEPVGLLEDVVRPVLELAAPLAMGASVAMRCEVPADLIMAADPLRLRQILINLLQNGVKFTPPGGSVTVSAMLAQGGVEIRVEDTGIGMDEDEVETALEPFGQVENQAVSRGAGTGLGLPLSRRLVEMHGGELAIRSRKGTGTSILIRIPSPNRAA